MSEAWTSNTILLPGPPTLTRTELAAGEVQTAGVGVGRMREEPKQPVTCVWEPHGPRSFCRHNNAEKEFLGEETETQR